MYIARQDKGSVLRLAIDILQVKVLVTLEHRFVPVYYWLVHHRRQCYALILPIQRYTRRFIVFQDIVGSEFFALDVLGYAVVRSF